MAELPQINRKELKKPDQFVQRGHQALEVVYRSRRPLMMIGILTISVVLVVYAFGWWRDRKLMAGWDQYHTVMSLPEAERLEKLKGVYSAQTPSRAALFAATTLADHFFEEARKENMTGAPKPGASAALAVEWYGKAINTRGLLSTEKQLLLINRGQAFELQGQYDLATKDYQSAVNEATGEAKGFALLNLGRAFELKNEIDQALKTYEKVTTDFSNSEYARVAKNYLRRLKSPLFKEKQG